MQREKITILALMKEVENFARKIKTDYEGIRAVKICFKDKYGRKMGIRVGCLKGTEEEKRRPEEHDDLVHAMICQIIRQKEELKKAEEQDGLGSTVYINNAGALRGMQEMTCLIGGELGYTVEELNKISKREERLRDAFK